MALPIAAAMAMTEPAIFPTASPAMAISYFQVGGII